MADGRPAAPLRRRLVLGISVIVTLALLAVGLVTYISVRGWLLSQVDDNLVAVRTTTLGPPETVPDAVRSWSQQGAIVYLVDSVGSAQVLTVTYPQSSKPGGPAVSAADVAVLRSVPVDPNTAPITVNLALTGSARSVAIADAGGARLVAAVPLAPALSIAQTVLTLQIVAAALALLTIALTASWFIRRSLRPLEEVARTAGEVTRLQLQSGDVTIPARAPPADPNTEVGQVVTAVNTMLDHVERSLRERAQTETQLRRFVSDAGHELRTPLASVRGYAELLRRAGTEHPEQAIESAGRIEAAAARMGALVDDLLLLAALDEGRPLDVVPVDLDEVVANVVTDVQVAYPEHSWIVNLDPLRLTGDPLRLHQVFTNVLSNAALHTPPGTTVRVYGSIEGSHVRVAIRDDGPGFAADVLPRATERFARGDASRSRATGSTGLGLAIAKAIVDAHDGSLRTANDGGAVVTIELPGLVMSNESEAPSDNSEPPTRTPLKVTE